jgi:AbrB family looped-hinge helix DNA binding protein
MITTRMSTKGQVIIPKAIRDQIGSVAGTQYAVDIERGAIRLTPQADYRSRVEATTIGDVAGCLTYSGPSVSPEQMKLTVKARAVQRFNRSAS